jgi:hypothetical protein
MQPDPGTVSPRLGSNEPLTSAGNAVTTDDRIEGTAGGIGADASGSAEPVTPAPVTSEPDAPPPAEPEPVKAEAPPPPAESPADAERVAVNRPTLLDRLIPVLAALVGLIALAGAVLVEFHANEHTREVSAELNGLKAGIARLEAETAEIAKAQDNGTVEALLALQDRIAKLARAAEAAPAVAPAPGGEAAAAGEAATAGSAAATGDCIPVGIRFMATPNETYPLCATDMAIKVGMIGDGTVDIAGTGTVAASGFGTIPNSKCTIMVLSADQAGFAEMRVSCG